MKVWFEAALGASDYPLNVARQSFAGADFMATDLQSADVVVVVTAGYLTGRQWALEQQRFPDKLRLCYCESDMPNLSIRGLYPSAYKCLPGRLPLPYFSARHAMPDDSAIKPVAQRSRQVGFRGRMETHPVRSELQRVLGSEVMSPFVLPPSADGSCRYCHELADTVFSLCPRGFGSSSFRLFESMAWGCIPVIVSDAFQPFGPGLDWDDFSIRVRESDIEDIPARLVAVADRAEVMSASARAAWQQYFSLDALRRQFPDLIAAVLATPEIRQRERIVMGLSRYHVGAWLTDRLGR